jgi:Zn-dependent protease
MGVSPSQIIDFLFFFPILIISVALHEFAHCWTSDRLGDATPRRLGRVTLNPLAHLDPLGTVMMAVCAFSGFGLGWGKASPFNPLNFKHPTRDRMLTALAGPLSNILQMLCWASLGLIVTNLPFLPDHAAHLAGSFCGTGVYINGFLLAFNLIPIYPLDGHHVLSYLAPPSWRPIIDNRSWGIVFLLIVILPPLRDVLYATVLTPVTSWLFMGTSYLIGWPIWQ